MSDSTSVIPPRVRPNDTVAVCAPAGPVTPERLRAGVKALGRRYQVVFEEGVLARQGYLAGGDERRVEELNRYLRDPDVRAVILARGGYGLLRILPALDADALRRDPKVLVGFSDGTALLFWALARAGVRGIHGPMAARFSELGPEDRDWLVRLMEEPAPVGPIPAALSAIGVPLPGPVSGPLLGGNLTMLSHLIGTPYFSGLADSIFFFEDVGERPYRIDRYLTHLHLAGALARVRAVALGELCRCEESSGPAAPGAEEVVGERLRAFGLGGLRGLPSGHGARNLALPLGARCEIDVSRARMTLLEGAVA